VQDVTEPAGHLRAQAALDAKAHRAGLVAFAVGALGVRDHDHVDRDRVPVQHQRSEQVEERVPVVALHPGATAQHLVHLHRLLDRADGVDDHGAYVAVEACFRDNSRCLLLVDALNVMWIIVGR
jgi:hypothetical protein